MAIQTVPRFTAETRTADEVEYFSRGGLTDAELASYARRTTRHPGLCFAVLAASPFVAELICRLLGAW
ncbi:hypothetical protein [Burkholderia sp. Ax-1724]|uniref:hypothetical protein n=1 Tax=Burkholderia sp. Ax-1724 TaxID=2608336 RepID=UPI0014237BD1|nr:hypothetical protein [Burkholderia sp. Ax-1724]NIF51435.1 hypothetical protein [Burkholderia sp. Ax-1724]